MFRGKEIPQEMKVNDLFEKFKEIIDDQKSTKRNIKKELCCLVKEINKLQTEYQNGDFFDTSLEHGRLRAQKKNMINNNKIKNNMMAYSNFENPKISDYYRKYVNNDDNILIKERWVSNG